jgi:hypothetical protein
MRTDYGVNSNTYRVRVLGEFANMGRDQVVEDRFLERVFSHGLGKLGKEKHKRTYKRRMGIDPAWTGDDDTGVVIREGDEILHVESWHGFDIVESFQRAKIIFDEWDCDALHVDAVGVGAGLFDIFRHTNYKGGMGYPAIKVMCNESSPVDEDGECAKLRDWLWWKCRKFFRARNVKFAGRPDDPAWKQLVDEIMAPTYKIQNGKIKVEGKDEMKTRGLRSPNLADALNLTFFEDFELFNVKYNIENRNKTAYDAYRQRWKKEVPGNWKGC